MEGTYAGLDSSLSQALKHKIHLCGSALPLELEPPPGPTAGG